MQVPLELLDVHRLLEDLEVLQPLLLGDGRQHRQRRLHQMNQVGSHVLTLVAVLRLRHRGPGEAGLVKIYYPEPVVLGPGQLPLHGRQLLLHLLRVLVLGLLEPPECPLLDLVLVVNLPQQRRVHVG